MKCAEMASKLLARGAMTTTLPLKMAARTSAPWSVDSFVVDQRHNSVIQYAEMGSLLVSKSATIVTPSAGMVAAAAVQKSLDGTALPQNALPQNADRSVMLDIAGWMVVSACSAPPAHTKQSQGLQYVMLARRILMLRWGAQPWLPARVSLGRRGLLVASHRVCGMRCLPGEF